MTSKRNQHSTLMTANELKTIQGSSLDPQWQDVLNLGFDGKTEQACQLAAMLLPQSIMLLMPPESNEKQIDLEIVDGVIGTLGNLAICNDGVNQSMLELYCQAVDMGFYAYAYNAANGILERAKTREDYRRAQAYFKISIATATDPGLKGAALVNYCPIVRDGLITGEPDLEGALALYRQAANLGLITAMFNYANVCVWQISDHEAQHVDEAAMWLRKLLGIMADGKELLEMDEASNLASMYEGAHHLLARFNIEGLLQDSSFSEGIALLKRSIRLSSKDLMRKRRNLECAYTRKLSTLNVERLMPAYAWHYVLDAIDWMPGQPHRLDQFKAAVMQVGNAEANLFFVVMDDFFYPDRSYKTLSALDRHMQNTGITCYFVVSGYGLYRTVDDREVVPLVVMNAGSRYLGALNLEETPIVQLEASVSGRPLTDCINQLMSNIIPLTVNVLKERSAMNQELLPSSRYLVLENDWKLPFYKTTPTLSLLE